MTINADSVGELFTTDGLDVWRCMAYCGQPTATMENVETKQQRGGSVYSLNLAPFKRLKIGNDTI